MKQAGKELWDKRTADCERLFNTIENYLRLDLESLKLNFQAPVVQKPITINHGVA